ncbi:hypothetical protein BASA61_008833 [Batrachochytrium salamandrivorans]|nr:hypothetical protein BASA60_010288 [Batrachochytrium salamandrivorans]KAH6581945.1 hypothetical protein BASA61_008833 [Batrachochytrium salamandrivorans]KAH9270229.1 hypothetical protein BASA83_007566 [Batrachochytrium salamandrivorans]KAJ1336449.1 hypothetical protein BSLG_007233 [Batrachochytrium salamandrivorans]
MQVLPLADVPMISLDDLQDSLFSPIAREDEVASGGAFLLPSSHTDPLPPQLQLEQLEQLHELPRTEQLEQQPLLSQLEKLFQLPQSLATASTDLAGNTTALQSDTVVHPINSDIKVVGFEESINIISFKEVRHPTLPAGLWERVFMELIDYPIALETLSRCCHSFRNICAEPTIRSHLLLATHGPHLVFHQIYSKSPATLTFELAESLIKCGALLPKFFIEQVYRNSIHNPSLLPPGTAEFFVAYGYKQYGDKLLIGGVDPMDEDQNMEWMDDSSELFIACARVQVDVARVQIIANDHYYVPALNSNPPNPKLDLESLWDSLSRLAIVDPQMTFHLATHSGVPFEVANDAIVMRTLRNADWERDQIEKLRYAGFSLSSGAVIPLLIDNRIMTKEFSIIRSLIAEVFTHDHILAIMEDAFYELFRNNRRTSVRTADYLITEFKVPELSVARALLAQPYNIREMRLKRLDQLPMATTFGVTFGGMSDAIWPILATRYGLDHVFLEACVIDLLVGGTVDVIAPNSDAQPSASKSGTSSSPEPSERSTKASVESLRQRPNSTVSPNRMLFQWLLRQAPPDLDETTEMATRDSLHAVFDLGIPIRPSATFPPVAHMVYTCRKAAPRFLQYMAHVERGLLRLSSVRSEYESFPTQEWLNIFHEVVLDEPEWINVIPPDSLSASSSLSFLHPDSDANANSQSISAPDSPTSVTSVPSLLGSTTAPVSGSSHAQQHDQSSKSIFSSKGLFYSLSETVRKMDPRELQWKDTRRFYLALRELAAVLEEDLAIQTMQKRSTLASDVFTSDMMDSTSGELLATDDTAHINTEALNFELLVTTENEDRDDVTGVVSASISEASLVDLSTPVITEKMTESPLIQKEEISLPGNADNALEINSANVSDTDEVETVKSDSDSPVDLLHPTDTDTKPEENGEIPEKDSTYAQHKEDISEDKLKVDSVMHTPLIARRSYSREMDTDSMSEFSDRTMLAPLLISGMPSRDSYEKGEKASHPLTHSQPSLHPLSMRKNFYDAPRRRRLLRACGGMGPFQQWLKEVETAEAAAIIAAEDQARSEAAAIKASHTSSVGSSEPHLGSSTNDWASSRNSTIPNGLLPTSGAGATATAMSAVASTTSWVRSWFST